VALPRYDAGMRSYCAAQISGDLGALARAAYGIPEPAAEAACLDLNRLDFVLVPGLAFDLWGRRLGRGKGFYDRLLAQVNGIKCGVALDQQIVEQLPAEAHDISMNLILTPTRWLAPTAGT
jgi:5-formyltetrahydrofolate cyclo-ligase